MDNIHRLLLIGILCAAFVSCGANYEKNEAMTKEQLMREAIRLSEENVTIGNDKDDAKAIDFDDSFIYDELALPRGERRLPVEVLLDNEAIKVFEMWKNKADKVEY